MYQNTLTLNNGVKIQQLGLGTWFIPDDQAAEAVKAAVALGYRHIDTAQAYGNERGVGDGVRTCGVPREELFVVSKVAAEHKTYESAAASIDETLAKMGPDYLDMMIIHSPQPWVEVNQSENRYVEGNRAAWRALEDAYKAGKLKAIGISNFQGEKLKKLLEECEIKPHVIQMEAHPYYRDEETISALAPCGCRVMAWYPLGHGDHALLEEPIVKELAEKYEKSTAQVILRWHTQVGNIVIPGSTNPEHIKANLDIFGFELTDEEMKKMEGLNKNVRYYYPDEEKLAAYVNMKIDLDSQK